MNLEQLGYNSNWKRKITESGMDSFAVGRIAAEHRERYSVLTEDGVFDGEIIGNLRYTAESRSDFPAVGDWVAISSYDDEKVLIHAVLPRDSLIERQAVGKQGEKQIIAANIDVAFIMQAVNRDFSINRLERYLTICFQSGVEPVILLTKIDLIDQGTLQNLVEQIKHRHKNLSILNLSNTEGTGLEEIKKRL